jgi:hypothetical protein
LLVRVRDRFGRWLGRASLEGFEAVAAGVLGEVDDRLEKIELVMSCASTGKNYPNLQSLHLISDNSPFLLIGVSLRFLDVCVCLLYGFE